MFKKIALLVLMFTFVMGTVHASSINGDHNGYPIVKVVTGGLFNPEEVESEVPAIVYEGTAMIPISVLKQLGAFVTWNDETNTVRISIPQLPKNPDIDLVFLASILEENSVSHVEYLAVSENTQFTRISINYKGTFLDRQYTETDFFQILSAGAITDAMVIQINDSNGSIMWAYSNYVKDYVYGKNSYDEFKNNLHISFSPNANQQQPSTITESPPALYSNDGKTYLGKLSSNSHDTDSVYNQYGTYGSKFMADSIWNQFGTYGSQFSNTSAFNKFASEPPLIIQDGKVIGYLTTNSSLDGAVSPIGLLDWLTKRGF